MATPADAVETRRNVSGAQVAAVVGGLLVAVALLWFFFLRGGGEESQETAAPSITPEAPAFPEETPPPGEGRDREPVETFSIFAPKDPFEPLVFAAGAPGATGTTGTTGDGTGENGDGTGTGDNGDGNGSAPGDGGGDGNGNIGGHRVRVIDVFTEGGRDRAQIQVDGTVYTVDVGETFADNFELVGTSGRCATVLFGDDQFTICEGEEILK